MSLADQRLTRRQWIAGLASSHLLAHASYSPRLAAGFYVWTQQFRAQKRSLAEGIPEALAATRRAGFRAVELMAQCFDAETAGITLKAVRESRLEAPSVYSSGPMHAAAEAEQTIAETLRLAAAARAAGAHLVNFNPSPKPNKERKSDEELDAQACHVNALAEKLRLQGFRLHLHHHDPEMADNAREWRHLLAHTDPKLVGFCVDVDWVHRGGQNPIEILEAAAPRLMSLHVRNSRGGIWTEQFGEGDIDYREVAACLKRIGFQGWLIVELAYSKETAVTRSLEENLRLSRRYAEEVFSLS
ncbi:MAG: sugar phosphate isomerase/epimerase [Bryobacterales bacterium]|nr:sugar phosphate isomerase/epimerase [Bryobacteraceae bacterium]MDW8129603.1 sugar phosphate isomerase/epimerase [Bryobacterales bacterium]